MVADKSYVLRKTSGTTSTSPLRSSAPMRRTKAQMSANVVESTTHVRKYATRQAEAETKTQKLEHINALHVQEDVDMDEENVDEDDDLEVDVGDTTTTSNFSLRSHFDNDRRNHGSVTEMLKTLVCTGNIVAVGKLIRESMANGELNDVEVQEISKSLRKPNINMRSYCDEANKCQNLEDMRNLFVGDKFLNQLTSVEEKKLNNLEAKVHNISKNVAQKQLVGSVTKKQLNRAYSIQMDETSVLISLNEYYNHTVIAGCSPSEQMTHIFSQLFRELYHPAFSVWIYTFRPSCRRQNDKHFLSIPSEATLELVEFGLDILGLYLPDDLVNGMYSPDHEFLASLVEENKNDEIVRRRKCRAAGVQLIENSIGRSLRNLRQYHYDLDTMKLVPCPLRGKCQAHLRWDSLRCYRLDLAENNQDIQFTVQNAMEYQQLLDAAPKSHVNDMSTTDSPTSN